MSVDRFEVIVVGGGMVGATLAALLGQQGIAVAVLETQPPPAWSPESLPDIRVSSVNAASQQAFAAAGAWNGMTARRSCPFRRLRVWAQGGHHGTTFSAEELGVDRLGDFVENRIIQLALWERLGELGTVQRYCPARPVAIEPTGASEVELTLDDGRRLLGRLVVGADGARSSVRTLAGIGVEQHDYRQQAMIINVATRLPQQDITWQCFTPEGPLAFLPLQGAYASLVWYGRPDLVRQRLALSDQALLEAVESAFPEELGGVRAIVGRGSFPIRRLHARRYRGYRLALVGDAAHVIHPLAGQGLNLGIQDVTDLYRRITRTMAHGGDPGSTGLLAGYEARRRPANLTMMLAMSSFHRIFTGDGATLRRAGALGLGMAEHLGPAKRLALRHALGLSALAGGGLAAAD